MSCWQQSLTKRSFAEKHIIWQAYIPLPVVSVALKPRADVTA